MSGRLFLLVVPFCLVLALLWFVAHYLAVPADRESRVTEHTRVVLVRLVGVVIGIVTWLSLAGADQLRLGRNLVLAPAIVGIGAVAGVIFGELIVRPTNASGPRSAALTPRRVHDYLPRWLTTAVVAYGAALCLLLLITTLTATSDDMGRAGRQLTWHCSPLTMGGASPYPGSFYSAPLVAALTALIGMSGLAARQVVLRPRGAAPEESMDWLRRRSLRTIVAATGMTVSLSGVGVAGVTAIALLPTGECPTPWMTLLVWLSGLLIVAGLIMSTWCAVALLGPRSTTTATSARYAEDAPAETTNA